MSNCNKCGIVALNTLFGSLKFHKYVPVMGLELQLTIILVTDCFLIG